VRLALALLARVLSRSPLALQELHLLEEANYHLRTSLG
jgi:hypothetical protein